MYVKVIIYKLLYFDFYTTNFNQSHENDAMVAANRSVISADLEKVAHCQISQNINISAVISDRYQQYFLQKDNAVIGVVALICADPHWVVRDNSLPYVDATPPTSHLFAVLPI